MQEKELNDKPTAVELADEEIEDVAGGRRSDTFVQRVCKKCNCLFSRALDDCPNCGEPY